MAATLVCCMEPHAKKNNYKKAAQAIQKYNFYKYISDLYLNRQYFLVADWNIRVTIEGQELASVKVHF